jgi:sulfite reductase beta subunit-like hemoprotein
MTLTAEPTVGVEQLRLDPPDIPRRPIDADQQRDIDAFADMLDRYLAGAVDEDVFRVFRLTNGIYGQRQGGHNQMVRVKVPYGSIDPEQLDMLGWLVDTFSRGWGHITTRQNVQFHYAPLEQIPEIMSHLASVGLTTREACGDTVRNVQGCHLAGACPFEVLDISPWAEATYEHFVRNPLGQRLPRKFKINFSGCDTDCGQAMFNDVGVVATARRRHDGSIEPGFRVYVAGGLGANPHPALALEEFTSRLDLLPTIESILRVFDRAGNRDNKLRARMKWLVDTLGFEELQRRVLQTRRFLVASATWPGGIPDAVARSGDAPAGVAAGAAPTPVGHGVPVTLALRSPARPDDAPGNADEFTRWAAVNVVRGSAKGTVSAYAHAPLGDITGDQFRALASAQRELGASVRLTNRQNVVFRDLAEAQLPVLHARLSTIGMATPGAELVRDVVSCPGSDTCNLAVTQSRGLAKAIGEALEAEGLAEVGGIRINISGCTNSCGQHHAADIGLFGAERRAHGQSAPGYQLLLGGHVGQEQIHFGTKALRVPAKAAPEATVRVVRRFAQERQAGETFRGWLDRSGGVAAVAAGLKDLDEFPEPDQSPDFYVDYDEAGPYIAEVGASECAT